MSVDFIIVFCTTPGKDSAEKIARSLVEKRLAACANIVDNITSIYRWKGEICRDDEAMLLIKTTADAYEALEKEIKARHPYDTPEIVALPLLKGSAEYLKWIGESLKSDSLPEQDR